MAFLTNRAENPREFFAKNLHCSKVVVQCDVGWFCINGSNGSHFFEDGNKRSVTINSELYIIYYKRFSSQNWLYGDYQMMLCYSNKKTKNFMRILQEFFIDRIISWFGNSRWTSRSQLESQGGCLTATNFFLWRVFESNGLCKSYYNNWGAHSSRNHRNR